MEILTVEGSDHVGRAGISLVSVVVPAFDEARSIEELYLRTRAVMDELGYPFEFILIDDGSTDGTAETIVSLSRQYDGISVLRHFRNHGKSLALMQGFAFASGDVAVVMDADLQDLPEMLRRFFEKLGEGYDLVNGWRIMRVDSLAKRAMSKLFNVIAGRILGNQVHDITCGLKVMTRMVFKSLELRGDLHRLIPALATFSGFRVGEVRIEHAERKYGVSKYHLMRHRSLLDIVAVAASQATQLRPFHVFVEWAVILSALALLGFAGWLVLMIMPPADTELMRIITRLLGLATAWVILLATILPFVGFILDVTTSRAQNSTWRRRLVKIVVDGRS